MKNIFRRGVVTFVFDDGYERVYQTVLPILKRYKARGVFAIPLDGSRVESSSYRYVKIPEKVRPWTDWRHISHDGHEIAAHSETHRDLTAISETQLERELKSPAQALGAQTFVYPGGAHNDEVVERTRRYYAAARTVRRGFESLPPTDPYRLRTFNFSRNNFRLWKANLFALWAWITNSWMIETYHMVDGDNSKMVHTVKTNDFIRHLHFVSSLPVRIRTIKEVIHP